MVITLLVFKSRLILQLKMMVVTNMLLKTFMPTGNMENTVTKHPNTSPKVASLHPTDTNDSNDKQDS